MKKFWSRGEGKFIAPTLQIRHWQVYWSSQATRLAWNKKKWWHKNMTILHWESTHVSKWRLLEISWIGIPKTADHRLAYIKVWRTHTSMHVSCTSVGTDSTAVSVSLITRRDRQLLPQYSVYTPGTLSNALIYFPFWKNWQLASSRTKLVVLWLSTNRPGVERQWSLWQF